MSRITIGVNVQVRATKRRKRTSIGLHGRPNNKHKRLAWKPYHRQGR